MKGKEVKKEKKKCKDEKGKVKNLSDYQKEKMAKTDSPIHAIPKK
ncbi:MULTISPECIES: hypothetical protein [Odoribacteraceae]|nr:MULTISPECIES: hypothetical protein [Odoribacteraceae]MCQ4872332.1 hypothetical protein [Butyricimonas paravirosa]